MEVVYGVEGGGGLEKGLSSTVLYVPLLSAVGC